MKQQWKFFNWILLSCYIIAAGLRYGLLGNILMNNNGKYLNCADPGQLLWLLELVSYENLMDGFSDSIQQLHCF